VARARHRRDPADGDLVVARLEPVPADRRRESPRRRRHADGKLQSDIAKYPDLPALIAYVHANGLKFGLHSGTGALVCGSSMPGSRDREELDPQTFAAWGVDYLEYDTCGGENDAAARVKKMSDALKQAGRPITLATLDMLPPGYRQWEWAPGAGAHTWQLNAALAEPLAAVMNEVDKQPALAGRTGPGGWSDPGQLNFGFLDLPVRRAQFSLRALLNAPLMPNESFPLDTIGNRDVIAVDQDWAGTPGRKVRDLSEGEVWAKPMTDGSVAVLLLNRGGYARTIPFDLAESGIAAASLPRPRPLDRRGADQHRDAARVRARAVRRLPARVVRAARHHRAAGDAGRAAAGWLPGRPGGRRHGDADQRRRHPRHRRAVHDHRAGRLAAGRARAGHRPARLAGQHGDAGHHAPADRDPGREGAGRGERHLHHRGGFADRGGLGRGAAGVRAVDRHDVRVHAAVAVLRERGSASSNAAA
jgi:hypothetical protein